LVVVALFAAWYIWQSYFNGLWTRDARVVARVIQVAPDVAGRPAEVPVREGQKVAKGEVLFRIDPERYQLALREAEADSSKSQAELQLQQKEVLRREHLGKNVSREDLDQARAALATAKTSFALADAQLAMARLNLTRTEVTAPVAGNVSRLGAYAGDYAQVGLPVVTPSFDWVRLAQRIPVEIRLVDPPADLLLSAGMTASVEVR